MKPGWIRARGPKVRQNSASTKPLSNGGQPMNRSDLVKAIAAQTEVDAKTVDAVLKGFTDVTTHVVAKGEPVAISGFAKFDRGERKARTGRNPQTGETIKIAKSKAVKVTAGATLKAIAKGDKPAPK